MALHASFFAWSEGAEQGLEFLGLAESLIADGKVDDAKKALAAFAILSKPEIGAPLLDPATIQELRRVAEGNIVSYHFDKRHCHASAHEAVHFLSLMVSHPPRAGLINHLGDAISPLRVGLQCERAKLMSSVNPTATLTPDDIYILKVLDAHRGKSLTFSEIVAASTNMNLSRPAEIFTPPCCTVFSEISA